MPTALCFPSYLGSGFGHISRCLALAEELRSRDWSVHLALAGMHAERVRRAGFPVHEPRRPFRPKAAPSHGPAFTLFSDMNFQIVRDRFVSARIVRASAREAQRLVKRVKPDVLIGDTWPLTLIIGQRAGLPVVQIVKSVVHPACPRLIWWEEPPPGLTSPDIRQVFNPILQKWGMAPIVRAEDLLNGDLLLVPSIPALDPLPSGLPATHYVGPLTQVNPEAAEPAGWFAQLSTDRPLIYVTIGGGADPVEGSRLFEVLYEAFRDLPMQVVASTSARFRPGDLPTPPKNVLLKNWVPGLAMIARSDVVVFHGGYGTMMETIRCGVPSLIIPFHSEQEANGRRLASKGAGIVLRHSDGPYASARVRWRGGFFSILVASESSLVPSALHYAVDRLLSNGSFRQSAVRLKRDIAGYGGPGEAADLLENLLR